jgi:hypothetical protein
MWFSVLVGSVGLAACAGVDLPTDSDAVGKPSFALGAVPGNDPTPELGQLKICKAGNTSGDFLVSGVGSTLGAIFAAAPTIAAGTCVYAAESFSPSGDFYTVTFSESNTTNLTGVTGKRIDDTGDPAFFVCGVDPAPACGNGGSVDLNNFHGYTFTFTNTLPPPPGGCTYTKGWYQNKNGSLTVVGYDGRTQAQAQAIFNATPGKPGAVTWEGKNLLLNLYQQFLAALENLDGDLTGGPDDVDDAIAAVADGTAGGGTAITTTLTQTEMSNWTSVLSAFNEGTYADWPHCGT